MTYKQRFYTRKSIRMRGYDYSQQGLYFITICTQNRACLFGTIAHGSMILNESGEMVQNQWLQMSKRFPNIVLHEYIIMPNHIHVILEIVPVGATLVVALENGYVVALDNGNMVNHNNDVVAAIDNVNANYHNNVNVVALNNDNAHENMVTQNQKCESRQEGQPQGIAPTITIGDIIGAFKSITTNEYIRGVTNKYWKPFDRKIWQRNYHEHIIRNEQSYFRIMEYIIQNPNMWKDDMFFS